MIKMVLMKWDTAPENGSNLGFGRIALHRVHGDLLQAVVSTEN